MNAERKRRRIAGWLGVAGGAIGVLAGLVELTLGPSVRDWVGAKQDTTRLGLTTTILAAVALAAAVELRRSDHQDRHRVAIAFGLLVPGLICFTTVGRLWYLPGVLLVAAGALVVAGTPRAALAEAFDDRHRRAGLLVLCGVYYVFLGATALGTAGLLGILGGVLMWLAVRAAPDAPHLAFLLLVTGALPFAAATWWSVVTPLIAVLALAIGSAVILDATSRPVGHGHPRGTA